MSVTNFHASVRDSPEGIARFAADLTAERATNELVEACKEGSMTIAYVLVAV